MFEFGIKIVDVSTNPPLEIPAYWPENDNKTKSVGHQSTTISLQEDRNRSLVS